MLQAIYTSLVIVILSFFNSLTSPTEYDETNENMNKRSGSAPSLFTRNPKNILFVCKMKKDPHSLKAPIRATLFISFLMNTC